MNPNGCRKFTVVSDERLDSSQSLGMTTFLGSLTNNRKN